MISGETGNTLALAVITGASSGIGRAFASIFAKQGCSLFLIDRNFKTTIETQNALTKEGAHSITFCEGDLAHESFLSSIPEKIRGIGLPVHYLINNAGIATQGDFLSNAWKKELASIHVNVLAPTLLTKLLLPELIKAQGSILFVSSTAAFLPVPGLCVYGATKSFLLSLSETLRIELKALAVSVTVLLPGPTQTSFYKNNGMNSLSSKRFPTAEEVAIFGYRSLKHKKSVAIYGAKNTFLFSVLRLFPSKFLSWLLEKIFLLRKRKTEKLLIAH